MKIGRVTISDRASAGVYADRSGPEIERILRESLAPAAVFVVAVIPDDQDAIAQTLRRLADEEQCDVIVTTGGTGVAVRDVTPEATRAVLDKELPGFGEVMRMRSFDTVKTSILSRATAGVRRRSFIINLPGKPTAVAECLLILRDAILEGVQHLHGQQPPGH